MVTSVFVNYAYMYSARGKLHPPMAMMHSLFPFLVAMESRASRDESAWRGDSYEVQGRGCNSDRETLRERER